MYMQLLTSYVYRKLDHLAAYAASSTTNSLHLAMAELFLLKLITCDTESHVAIVEKLKLV